MSLSVIVPTIGRPSLRDALVSMALQLVGEDEVLVVADGSRPEAARIVSSFDWRFKFMEAPGPSSDWGNTPRNYGIERAKGSHLVFMDDDDVYLPKAFEAFRRAIAETPDRPHIFKMIHHERIIWQEPVLKRTNVSTQMFLIPNLPGRVGRWNKEYDGDFDFLYRTLLMYLDGPKVVVWQEDVVALLTAHRKGVF
jgi:glycosyltransferase involved in cell wall biosynthesis